MMLEPTFPVASVCDDVGIPTQIDNDLLCIIENFLRRDARVIASPFSVRSLKINLCCRTIMLYISDVLDRVFYFSCHRDTRHVVGGLRAAVRAPFPRDAGDSKGCRRR